MIKKEIAFFCVIALFSHALVGCGGPKEPGRYYNKGQNFSIKFPVEWNKVKSPAGVTVTYGSPENSLKIGVQKQKISAQQTLSQCIDYMKGHIRRTNGKVLNSGKSVINGTDAAWIRSEISGETALTYYMKKGNDIYSVIATAKGNDFNENKIYEVARSFRFE